MKENKCLENTRKLFRYIINKQYGPYLPFVLLFFVMIFIHRFIVLYSDDIWFLNASNKQNFREYITTRYNTWTGRISVEAIFYFLIKSKLEIWKIINPLVISIFAYLISRILLGKNNNSDNKALFIFNSFCCLLVGYMNISVISPSLFWATGSVYYLWTVTAALIALLPYRDSISSNINLNIFQYIGTIICAVFAAWGQEQTSFAILALSILVFAYTTIKNRKIHWFLLLETIVIVVFCLILFTAPGNKARYYSEVTRWFPNFTSLSVKYHIFLGIQWLLNFLINDGKLFLILIWAILIVSLYQKFKCGNKKWLSLIPLSGAVTISLPLISFKNLFAISTSVDLDAIIKRYLFDFNEVSLHNPNLSLLPYIVWGGFLFLTPILLVQLFGRNIKSALSVLIILVAVCSSVMMFFSPTIYISGYRVFFIMSVLLIILQGMLLLENKWLLKIKYMVFFSIFPLIQLFFILVMWVKEHRTFI